MFLYDIYKNDDIDSFVSNIFYMDVIYDRHGSGLIEACKYGSINILRYTNWPYARYIDRESIYSKCLMYAKETNNKHIIEYVSNTLVKRLGIL